MSRPIRVLYVINSLGAGGAEHSLAEMLEPLRAGGVEATVACLSTALEGSEASVAASGTPLHILGRWWPLRRLRRLIRATAADIVHTTLFEADIAGRLAAAGTGAAVLTSLVNTTYDRVRLDDPQIKAGVLAAYREVDGLTARHLTTHLHAITEAVKRSAVASLRVRPDRVTVIERGRDPGRLGEPSPQRRAAARSRLGLTDEVVLVNVGRQEYQKGHTVLLEAMRLLLADRPGLVLLQAGRQGRATPAVEEACRRSGVGSSVRLLGHRGDVAELLAAADVFVFPSHYEGLGGSLIEAMALGLPIVASDLPAVREVVEEGGNALLAPAGDPVALAASVSRLLDDAGRRRHFGARSRSLFEARFTLQRSADRMLDLYRQMAPTARARSGRR